MIPLNEKQLAVLEAGIAVSEKLLEGLRETPAAYLDGDPPSEDVGFGLGERFDEIEKAEYNLGRMKRLLLSTRMGSPQPAKV